MRFSIKAVLLLIILCNIFFIPTGCSLSQPAPTEEKSAANTAEEESLESGTVLEESVTLPEDTSETGKTLDIDISVDGIIDENEYANSFMDDSTGIELFWSNDGQDLYVGIIAGTSGWVAVGFDPRSGMRGANIIFMAFDGDTVVARDDFGTSTFAHEQDEELGGSSDISQFAGAREGNSAVYEFVIPTDSGDEFDGVLSSGNKYEVILAVNSGSIDFDTKHSARSSKEIQLD